MKEGNDFKYEDALIFFLQDGVKALLHLLHDTISSLLRLQL